MNALIGYTGLVGGNLRTQYKFDCEYNSKNIEDIRNKDFNLVVCAGVSGLKWYANKYPDIDLENINKLKENLHTIKCKKFVLISTVDVYKNPINMTEESTIEVSELHPYGYNRYELENWVKSNFNNYLIIRLPALFGNGLKKNFIYDLINRIPVTIIENKMKELKVLLNDNDYKFTKDLYHKTSYNNYNLIENISQEDKVKLLKIFSGIGFTSLDFTNSESIYQFYDLSYLWQHINIALSNNVTLLNLTVPPISSKVISKECMGFDFKNTTPLYIEYDIKTIHSDLFNAKNGYIFSREQVLQQVKSYIVSNNIKVEGRC